MEHFYIGTDELSSYGENTARTLLPAGRISPRRYLRELRFSVRRDLAAAETEEGSPGDASEWFRGNEFLLRQSYALVREALTGAPRLRRCGSEPLLTQLCQAFLAAGADISPRRLKLFLDGFRRQRPLEQRELSLLPDMLRSELLRMLEREFAATEPAGETVGTLFTSLRKLSSPVWAQVTAETDPMEALFLRDPAGTYPKMDERSRQDYRAETARLAHRYGRGEVRCAEEILSLADCARTPRQRHIGYWIYVRPLGKKPMKTQGGGYIAFLVLPTLFLSLGMGFLLGQPAAALLLLLPVSELLKAWTDRLLLRLTPPRRLPRLEMTDGIPPEGKTLCVVSVLLRNTGDAFRYARQLEEFSLADRDSTGNLNFGLLCDLPERLSPTVAEDEAILSSAQQEIEALNRRYGGRFFLFTRKRTLSPDGVYTGWERKRGALLSLGRLLKGEKSEMRVSAGDANALRDTEYILTLDADTRPAPGSLHRMIGTALHPLNRPVIDSRTGMVTAGYGVLHPRIAVSLADAGRSLFTRSYAAPGGSDPYGGASGELYMDRFDCGGFAGKGLLHLQSFLACTDHRLPENRVLSHDALEGALLRGGLVDDVEFTDGFPGSFGSYWSRQHRWVRGDWQNLPWLFRRGRALRPMDRWRLFDSLRRSLYPIGVLTAVTVGLFLPAGVGRVVGGVALLSLLFPALQAVWQALFRPIAGAKRLYFSPVPRGISRELWSCLLRLAFLPQEATINASAVFLALWRQFVSHRKLLQWRTAADSEGGTGEIAWRFVLPALLWGLGVLILCPSFSGKALGLLWMTGPLLSGALSSPVPGAVTLSNEDRLSLRADAGDILRYFLDHCTREEHYLPPDNRQLSPPLGIAHRTSPTNMGFALLALLSGADLKLVAPEEALSRAEMLLSSMEALPRWRGHFYNWYDTLSCRPLPPGYISSVDSGNLCACLLAAGSAFDGYARPESARRCRELAQSMDFRPLYDSERRLFRIGLVPEGQKDESWYDLLESESRLLSYTAIALGQVELRHWSSLGRAQTRCRGHRGMVSWSGSLFEYGMPGLLLPDTPDSHLWESARYALFVQRQRRNGRGIWGISESAFAALSPDMSYRYKAHGCARLALCTGMDTDAVFSPYSSYLCLGIDPTGAMDNLRRWKSAHMTCKYGLFEALDCTPGRCPPDGTPVRTVMAHHLGMSLVAITNVLLDGIWQKRFMALPAMAAYRSLLEEQVPQGDTLLRRRTVSPRPEGWAARDFPPMQSGDVTFLSRSGTPLSNGVYSLFCGDNGASRARFGNLAVYRPPMTPWDDSRGVSLGVLDGDGYHSLLPIPGESGTFSRKSEAGQVTISGERGEWRWSVRTLVSPEYNGEQRRIRLTHPKGCEGHLVLSLEPWLLPERDGTAHPSFARLGLFTRRDGNALLCHRLPRGTQGDVFLAVSCDREAVFSSDRRQFPGRGQGAALPEENTGWQCESCLSLLVPLDAGVSDETITFSLAVAPEENTALEGARAIHEERTGFSMVSAAAVTLGFTREDRVLTEVLLPRLAYPILSEEARKLPPPSSREELWHFGISGDVPILLFEGAADEAAQALRCHGFLAFCGIVCDLVFLTPPEEYRGAFRQRILTLLGKMGRDTVIGARGGVHFVPAFQGKALRASAACV